MRRGIRRLSASALAIGAIEAAEIDGG